MLHKLNTSELINKLRLTTGQNNFALYLSIKSLKIFFALMSFIMHLFLHFFLIMFCLLHRHPDKNNDPEAQEMFIKINEAHEVGWQ